MASQRGRSWREDWDLPAVGDGPAQARKAREVRLPQSQLARALSTTHGWALPQMRPWEPRGEPAAAHGCCHSHDQLPELEGAT